jgi:Zn-dependent M28 family amino/carboxypeptidase
VLAIGRALAPHRGRHDLRRVLFSGEEQGLLSSRHYVAGLSAGERDRIRAVVNMDMIAGRNTDSRTVLLEGAAVPQDVIDGLARLGMRHTAPWSSRPACIRSTATTSPSSTRASRPS